MNKKYSNEQDVFQIDIWKLLLVWLKKWWLIVLMGLSGVAVSLFITAYLITPLFRSRVTIYVNNSAVNSQSRDYVSSSDLSTSQRLVDTYTHMLSSDTVLEKVINSTGFQRTTNELRKMISAEQVEDTEIFNVFVVSPDPVEAAAIANAIAQTAPDVISDFVEGSSTKIIDYAKVATGRFKPSYKRNVVLGFAVGVVLSILLLTVQFMLDVRIKEESDLTDLFDIPVLGQIPDMEQSASSEGHHAYRKYTKYGTYGIYASRETSSAAEKEAEVK